MRWSRLLRGLELNRLYRQPDSQREVDVTSMFGKPGAGFRRGTPGTFQLAVALVTTTWLVSSTSFAQPDGTEAMVPLTLRGAAARAAAQSAAVMAQGQAARSARDMAVAAGQRPDPVLRLGINNLPVNGPDRFSVARDFMTMRSIAVMQELTRKDKREARSQRAMSEADQAEVQAQAMAAEAAAGAAGAWVDRRFAEQAIKAVEQQVAEARIAVEVAEIAYRTGRGSRADTQAAVVALGMLEDQQLEWSRRRDEANVMLARWIGDEAQAPLDAASVPDEAPLPQADFESVITGHPRIAALRAAETRAIADLAVARSETRSDWSVEVMYSQRGPTFSDMVSLNVSVPLQIRQDQRQMREVSARESLAARAMAEREEATRVLRSEALLMLTQWRSNRERLQRFASNVLSAANARVEASQTAYRTGAGTLPAVIEARRTALEHHFEHLKLEAETARVWAQLRYAIAAPALAMHTHSPPPAPGTPRLDHSTGMTTEVRK